MNLLFWGHVQFIIQRFSSKNLSFLLETELKLFIDDLNQTKFMSMNYLFLFNLKFN